MPEPVPVSTDSIYRQIDRILASRRFMNSERLRRLLRYLLDQTLQGRADQLKEYVLGVEVFDRGKDFDPQADAIVRSELSRLRAKLRDYYRNDGQRDALIIDLPNRSLALTFQPMEAAVGKLTPPAAWLRLNAKRAAAGGAILVGLTAIWAVARINNRPVPQSTFGGGPTSIAVLPFVNVGGEASTEYFCDGLTEELIHRLAEMSGLKVVSRTSAFRFKGKDDDLRSIASQLNVEVVLEGTVRRSGESLRITARLVNGADGYELLSSVYDRTPEDVLSVEKEIASQIASRLRVYQGGRGIPIRQYTKSLSAYRHYVEGCHYASEQNPLQLGQAIERFEQAVAADPNYAPAYAKLADTYITLSLLDEISPDEAYPRAKAAAQSAVNTGEDLGEAHSALGSVLALYDWDWAGADKEFRKALKLDPNDSGVLETYAMRYLLPQGRLVSALLEMQRAQSLDPFSPQIALGLGRVHFLQKDTEAAIRLFQKARHLDPTFEAVPMALAWAYIQKSLLAQALTTLEEDSAPTDDVARLAVLGYLYSRSGQASRARQVLQQLQELSSNRYVCGYYFALIQLGLGEKTAALGWLEKAAAERSPLIAYLNINPLFDSLRGEPRFLELLKKAGLAVAASEPTHSSLRLRPSGSFWRGSASAAPAILSIGAARASACCGATLPNRERSLYGC